MFRPDFFQHCFQSRSGKSLFLHSFCDVRINVCVWVTFVYFILNPTVSLSSNKSSGLSPPFSPSFFMFLQAFFATCKIKVLTRDWLAWLSMRKGYKARSLSGRVCVLTQHGIAWIDLGPISDHLLKRSRLDRSQIDLKKVRKFTFSSYKLKARSIWDRSSP